MFHASLPSGTKVQALDWDQYDYIVNMYIVYVTDTYPKQ